MAVLYGTAYPFTRLSSDLLLLDNDSVATATIFPTVFKPCNSLTDARVSPHFYVLCLDTRLESTNGHTASNRTLLGGIGPSAT